MNVLPNPFIINSSQSSTINNPIISTVASVCSPLTKTTDNNRTVVIKCAVCDELLLNNNLHNETATYRMLAVRPSIGSGSKDPFFPILETLTNTSALHVPCCLNCSDLLIEQWNCYESKNVSIKNRVYNLPKIMGNSKLHKNMAAGENNHKTTALSSTNTNTVSIDSRILAHSISLSNNLILINNSNSGHCDGKSSTPNPQDEVLDLSMSTGVNVKVDQPAVELTPSMIEVPPNLQSVNTLNLSNKVIAPTRPRSRNATTSTPASNNESVLNNSSNSFFLNSSMTNLIKVSSSPVQVQNSCLKAFHQNDTSSAGAVPAKRQLLSCALCDDSCPILYSILLRPMGNCPYFPTLTPYVKVNSIDSTGKISVCESCHHQLIVQWDAHQKSNKPIIERQYSLVRSTKVTSTNKGEINVLNNSIRNHVTQPISSQSYVSLVAANKTFVCVICGKDLLASASSNTLNHSSSNIAFSLSTENDTSGNVITKKLLVQSAQEINLLPFISSQTSPLNLNRLILLQESGRVLVCSTCFETMSSRIVNNSDGIVGTHNSSTPQSIEQSNKIKASSHDPSINGNMTKIVTTAVQNSNDDQSSIGNLLCLACNQHKYQYLVETKENHQKKPFFPFLHDPNEPEGRARLCAPCHLMLETQWDAYENSYVPFNQRVYRLPSSTNGQSTLITKRPPPLPAQSQVNGQATPSPLKIQIAVPNSSQTIVKATAAGGSANLISDHLLLTTVNQQQTNHNQIAQTSSDQLIFKLMNEFLASLGGPHPILSGSCVVCKQHTPAGQTYQIFCTSRNIILSSELGIYPYFPMLKSKKHSKNSDDKHPYIACTYCYHSLIAQWAAYHVSSKPEDRDLLTRLYNCRDFVCFVCGVTTYRQFVRSISVKDFSFLHEHKRPAGSLLINKGESVVTCLTCYQTLTHQWVENERMKVPLEMRKYNWMAIPPPPPPNSSPATNKIEQPDPKGPSTTDTPRTVIPIITNTQSLSYHHVNSNNQINHNGMISIPTNNEILPKAIIVNTTGGINPASLNNAGENVAIIKTVPANNLNVVAPTFNPSHTLAPLVAAAMAAQPVTINQENSNNNNNNNSSNNNSNQSNDTVLMNSTITTTSQPSSVNTTTGTSTGTFADILRQLARQQNQNISMHKMNDGQQQTHQSFYNSQSHHDTITNNHSSRSSSSINLTTLASVAALAGNRNNPSQLSSNSSLLSSTQSTNNNSDKHSELPKAVINSNSFAIHFKALSNTNSKSVKKPEESNCAKRNLLNDEQNKAQMMELEEFASDTTHDTSLSQVNMQAMRLREKRKIHLNKFKENLSKSEPSDTHIFDVQMPELEDNQSTDSSYDIPHSKRDSLIDFIDKVIPVLPLNEKASSKYKFMSLIGLTTHKNKRELELKNFSQRKLSRRLSVASFKVDWIQEEMDDTLLPDPEFEALKNAPYIRPSKNIITLPNEQSSNFEGKSKVIDALNLIPIISTEKQLKREYDWLWVQRNRRLRKKRDLICFGKNYNNLSKDVLNNWLLQLLQKSSSKSQDLKLMDKMLPDLISDLDGEFESIDNVTTNSNEENEMMINNEQKQPSNTYPNVTTNSNSSTTNKTINQTVVQDQQQISIVSSNNQASDDNQHQSSTPVNIVLNSTLNSVSNCNIKRIIDTKQFAQEFHESVLLETQKQMNDKQNALSSSMTTIINNGNIRSDIGQPIPTILATNTNPQAIIYSDHLKPTNKQQISIDSCNQLINANPDSNGLITITTVQSPSTVINSINKTQDKISIKDQILKSRLKINDINREYQLLNAKKNEILLAMQKLETERVLCQQELDRLSKCLIET